MIGRSSTVDVVKERALTGKDLAAQLARDSKFRKQIVSAVTHGNAARRRARSRIGFAAAVASLASDRRLRAELDEMAHELKHAWSRVERKRSHRIRNTVFVVAGLGAAAAVAGPRLKELFSGPDRPESGV